MSITSIPRELQIVHEPVPWLNVAFYVPYTQVWDRLVKERVGYKSVEFAAPRWAELFGEGDWISPAITFHFDRPWKHKNGNTVLAYCIPAGWDAAGWITPDRIDEEIDEVDKRIRSQFEPLEGDA